MSLNRWNVHVVLCTSSISRGTKMVKSFTCLLFWAKTYELYAILWGETWLSPVRETKSLFCLMNRDLKITHLLWSKNWNERHLYYTKNRGEKGQKRIHILTWSRILEFLHAKIHLHYPREDNYCLTTLSFLQFFYSS